MDTNRECFSSDELVFYVPATSNSMSVPVYISCCYGVCTCEYYLNNVNSQLKPCRFAYLLYGGFLPDVKKHELVYNVICHGFKLVESDFKPYDCANYSSILNDMSKPIMDGLVRKELAEVYISQVSEKPTCIHALGAVLKGSDSICSITDCSRPLGEAVNAHYGNLAKKFTYNSFHDVAACLVPNCYLSVIDIQSAFWAVPIFPAHRKYLGFRWELDGSDSYFIDNRLCFGVTTGPFYFHSISHFVAEILEIVFKIIIQ